MTEASITVARAREEFLTLVAGVRPELPIGQRSAVILKDVLGHSLAETAETMGTTIPRRQ